MGLGLGGLGRDKDPSIALEACWPCVIIEKILSQQTLGWRAASTQHGTTGHDRAKHSVRALCTRPDCYSALCCALFGSLYMDTVHGHY